jgi:hypothetical protein
LSPMLLTLLNSLATSLDAKLGTRLDKIYPPDTDNASDTKETPA